MECRRYQKTQKHILLAFLCPSQYLYWSYSRDTTTIRHWTNLIIRVKYVCVDRIMLTCAMGGVATLARNKIEHWHKPIWPYPTFSAHQPSRRTIHITDYDELINLNHNIDLNSKHINLGCRVIDPKVIINYKNTYVTFFPNMLYNSYKLNR